jgi:hypothetical protein
MSNTNIPSMQSDDQIQQAEANTAPKNQEYQVQQPSNAEPPVPAPTPTIKDRSTYSKHNLRAERTKTVLSPKPTKVTKKPVRKPAARIQPKINVDSDEDMSDDERVKTITVRQMSKKMTKLVGDVDDVAESYVVFLDQFTQGNGVEVRRLKGVLAKRRRRLSQG